MKLWSAIIFISLLVFAFLANVFVFSDTSEELNVIQANYSNDQEKILESKTSELTTKLEHPIKAPNSASDDNIEKSNDSHKDLSLKENVPNNTITTLDQLLVEENGQVIFYSKPIELMNKDELTVLIEDLPNTMTQAESAHIQIELAKALTEPYFEDEKLTMHNVHCSDSFCGFLFEGEELSSVQNTLSQITSMNSFKVNTGGGTLRILEENGVYYGVVVASIKGIPVTIR